MKIDRARAIYNELLSKPKRLKRATIVKFAEKHFISIRTVYYDLEKYQKLNNVKPLHNDSVKS